MQSGWLRASVRKLDARRSTLLEPVLSLRKRDAAPLPKGRFAKVTVPLYYQGHVYRAGSRMRVTLAAPRGDQPVWAFAELQPGKDTKVTSRASLAAVAARAAGGGGVTRRPPAAVPGPARASRAGRSCPSGAQRAAAERRLGRRVRLDAAHALVREREQEVRPASPGRRGGRRLRARASRTSRRAPRTSSSRVPSSRWANARPSPVKTRSQPACRRG